MEQKKILFIEDDRKLCSFMKRRLELDGRYAVVTAISGEEGCAESKKGDYDLVITDFRLPDMDGSAVVNELKKLMPNRPVLICTVHYDDGVIPMETISKADGMIAKPINHENLFKTIEQALAKNGR